jgi:hypothetical protein
MSNLRLLIVFLAHSMFVLFSGKRYLVPVTRILANPDYFVGLASATDTNSYFVQSGWLDTMTRGECIDRAGNPLPWLTYPMIEFIQQRLDPGMKVFEFGTGGSTLWWAQRVREVITIEHDPVWHERISPQLPENVTSVLQTSIDDGTYASQIRNHHKRFDIVVIDGRDRVKCAMNSIDALTDNGIIVWDNTDRAQYRDGIEYLHQQGFKRIAFSGLNPLVSFRCETSIFYRRENVFGI